MPLKYQHTQKAGLPFYLFLTVSVVVLFMVLQSGEIPIPALIIMLIVLPWGLLLMSSLTVTIDDTYLRVRFGPGVFFKTFRLSDIAGCGPNYKTYVWGWGIRWYIRGWLFNIAGFDSVEILFKNGKKARIGTDEPQKLAEAITQTIR